MEQLFDPNELIPSSPLGQIPAIFRKGRIPDELMPKTLDDWTVISRLQTAVWPITEALVAANAQDLELRLTLPKLCFLLASEILPYIRIVRHKALANEPGIRCDPRSELRALANFIHFQLTAPDEDGEVVSAKKLYGILSHQQLWLIHIWPNNPHMETAISREMITTWLNGTFLLVPIMRSALELLQWLSPGTYPGRRWIGY